MKSYTDLEQSEKLAEFLSPESADMYYPNRIDIKYQGALPIEYKHGNPLLSQEIAAWSLTALLDAIPVIAEYNGMPIRLRIDKGPIGNDEYAIWYEDLQTNLSTDIGTEADNFIDACYEMILKLNELNLL